MKIIKLFLLIIFLSTLLPGCSGCFRWQQEAEDVAIDEYGPKGMLKKYEWFINTNNAIQKMNAEIIIYKTAHEDVKKNYTQNYGLPNKWDIATKSMYNKEFSETKLTYTSIISQRNNLVKEYNAQSSKFNWSTFKSKPGCPPENIEEYKLE